MRKNILVALVIFMAVFTSSHSHAQDIHFSQYYFNPVMMNPAFTGFYRGQIRLAADYRKQWGFLPFPYITQTISVDSRLFSKKLNYNTFAVGLCVINDKAGIGNLATQGALLSSAVHINLLENGRSTIGAGLQAGMMQTFFDPTVLVFGDQVLSGSAVTTEQFAFTRVGYVDVSSGVIFTLSPSPKSNIYMGVALQHANKPLVTFYGQGETKKMASKLNAQLGTVFTLNKKTDILPSLLWMNQLASSQLFIGSSVVYRPNELIGLRTGTWFRYSGNGDALSVLIGADIQKLTVGFTYDFNVSSLKQVSKFKGAMEVALIYREGKSYGRGKYKRPKPQLTNCPVFDY